MSFLPNPKRIIFVYIFIMISAGIVFFKLYTVSISDYTKTAPALTNQYTGKLSVAQRRGFIFDRNGEILAGFDDVYNCIIDPSKISNSKDFINSGSDTVIQKIFDIRDNINISKDITMIADDENPHPIWSYVKKWVKIILMKI